MAATPDCTTVHGSRFLFRSEVFCCGRCGTPTNYVILPGGDYAHECANPTCGKTYHEDSPGDLQVQDDLVIDLSDLRPIATDVEVMAW